MTEENKVPVDPKDLLKLKLTEPEILGESPWDDDVLNRGQIAERLTNLIETQSVPFVISVHGAWGTGKTFMLKRWQKDLERQNFQAIYFNAWEDDFCDDPLLAILGQLSEYFQEAKLKEIAAQILRSAVPLLRQNALGILTKHTGVTLQLEGGNQDERDFLKEYLDQRATKDKVKKHLTEMSAEVFKTTKHPMVFIIDELDRCRPTFAIELLERVKHIFDIPNLVFVFGINRDELSKSFQSIYGDINADIYLRRFFDIEFILPEADTETFCRHMFQRFQLDEFFASLSRDSRSRVHSEEFRYLFDNISKVWARLGLSLRDIDYCVRFVALVAKNLNPQRSMYPELIGTLIPLKLANSSLYREFIQGNCTGSDVMNYIDKRMPEGESDSQMSNLLDVIEMSLYWSDSRFAPGDSGRPPSLSQLQLLSDGEKLTESHYLTQRTQTSDRNRIQRLNARADQLYRGGLPSGTIAYLSELIGLHQTALRR